MYEPPQIGWLGEFVCHGKNRTRVQVQGEVRERHRALQQGARPNLGPGDEGGHTVCLDSTICGRAFEGIGKFSDKRSAQDFIRKIPNVLGPGRLPSAGDNLVDGVQFGHTPLVGVRGRVRIIHDARVDDIQSPERTRQRMSRCRRPQFGNLSHAIFPGVLKKPLHDVDCSLIANPRNKCRRRIVRNLKFQGRVHRAFKLVEGPRFDSDGSAGSVHNPQR